ncbi:MAG TPA: xanthine dehydrogenase family protein molybdopterin-binding subunit [Micromonosporaceae bacterium]
MDSPRIDMPAKVSGQAQFLDDLSQPVGCLYAVAIRSTLPHARIRAIDAGCARASAGVRAVLTPTELYGLDPRIRIGEDAEDQSAPRGEQTVLTTDVARFEGDFLGLVVADDLEAARVAAATVIVDLEPLPALLTYPDAMAGDAVRVHSHLPDNIAFRDELAWGDVEVGLRDAAHVVTGDYFGGHAFHRPLEPATSCLVLPQGDELTVWASAKMPFSLRAQIARALSISPEVVRVRVPFIGGGFGAKQITPAMIATVAVSRALGRPVKYLATDHESFRVTSRHAVRYRARAGVDAHGHLRALDVDLELATGAYFTGARIVTHNACISAWGCYRIPHFRVRAVAAYTNTVPAASFRATGKNQTTFGVESLIETVAERIGISPTEMRTRNVLRRGEFVAETWRVRGEECVADVPPMDTDFGALIAAASGGIGWVPSDDAPAPARDDPGLVRGRGLALSLRHGTQGGGKAFAMVTVDVGGRITIRHNAPDLGTGVYNMLAVVAVECLGVARERISVSHPDTANGMVFVGTIAQRTTVEMGNAVQMACHRLIDDLCSVAAETYGGHRDDWRYQGGWLDRGDETHEMGDMLAAARSTLPVSIVAVGSYGYPPSADRAFGGMDHWAPGAVAVDVDVDVRTGQIRVRRICAVADAGAALHRTSAIRQVEGGAIMGLSLALYEELRYDETGLLNGDGWAYRIATIDDVPAEFSTILVENRDGPGPFGAKGLAQTSLPCMAPAIANAVFDAVGVRLTEVPFTPERVLRALRAYQTAAVLERR